MIPAIRTSTGTFVGISHADAYAAAGEPSLFEEGFIHAIHFFSREQALALAITLHLCAARAAGQLRTEDLN